MSLRFSPLPAPRFPEWRAATRERLISRNARSGLRTGADAVAHADLLLSELLPQGIDTATSRILLVSERDRELGTLWLGVGATLFLIDVAADVDGHQDEIVGEILRIARDSGATRLSTALFPQDGSGHALIARRGFTLASIQMILEPLPPRAPDGVLVEPMTPERFTTFAAASESAFADDLVTSGRYTREEALAESARQMAAELPDGRTTEGQRFFTASAEGQEVGILWIGARTRDGRPHAFVLDIEVAEDQRGKGYGRALMHAAEREARAFGADSIGLHVFGFNSGAVHLYESLGYRRVEESYVLDL
ncbi:GNAT family N-acetyltransferase [Streptomyces sp. AC495_CC817]|uniref:GNAT family N-acetyltransferase n=1 Tax=Streptomyces sp. AC495_CC817 TaxID=2823900 RepID=UPI001C27E339|nr:GNAT family N-acetyltransferase [Streptomyces sp. AC495_CC817]